MLFGTDGIRGTINKYPMLPCEILKFSLAIGSMLQKIAEEKHGKGYKPKVIIAKDTRLSGYIIESALTAGLASVGVNVTLVGPMPTASVPMLIKSIRADLGIMITASHNPFHDNGLKIFDDNGYKLSKDDEEFLHIIQEDAASFAEPSELGKVNRLEDVHGRYIEYVKSCFPKDLTLEGIRVVVDCANGAGYKIAPAVFWELGAEVVSLGVEPNGININEGCGAIFPGLLSAKVIETRSNIGIALDGDGDRLLVCDEMGKIVNGDHIIGIIAKFLQSKQRLKGGGIVVTRLANSALEEYLKNLGLHIYRTEVGDKNVAFEMKEKNCNFGGETSGHIILGDYTSTGDGIISALQILAFLKETGQPASDLLHPFQLMPQRSISVGIPYQSNPLEDQIKSSLIDNIRAENNDIRLIVRRSGTENVIRIMAEGKDERKLDMIIEMIKEVLLH
jgi:phosphoglucosamine mutase